MSAIKYCKHFLEQHQCQPEFPSCLPSKYFQKPIKSKLEDKGTNWKWKRNEKEKADEVIIQFLFSLNWETAALCTRLILIHEGEAQRDRTALLALR